MMKDLKNIDFAKCALIIINFLAVLFYSSVYLSATKYIIDNGLSRSLLEKISVIPSSPDQIFWLSNLFFAGLLLVIYIRNQKLKKETMVRDWFAIFEVLLLLATFVAMQFSYNGLILLVFIDIFFSYTDFYTFREKKSWLLLIVTSLSALLLSNYDVLSLLVKTPALDVYIGFFPAGQRSMSLS